MEHLVMQHSNWLNDLIGSGQVSFGLFTADEVRTGEIGRFDGFVIDESTEYTRTPVWRQKAKASVVARQRALNILGPKRGRWA